MMYCIELVAGPIEDNYSYVAPIATIIVFSYIIIVIFSYVIFSYIYSDSE